MSPRAICKCIVVLPIKITAVLAPMMMED
jgi:hypothetical protein